MIQLRRKQSTIEFPADVARVRRVLNAVGYDADDHDIQWAWSWWGEEEYCASWLAMHDLSDATILKAMLAMLEPTPPADAPPPSEPPLAR